MTGIEDYIRKAMEDGKIRLIPYASEIKWKCSWGTS